MAALTLVASIGCSEDTDLASPNTTTTTAAVSTIEELAPETTNGNSVVNDETPTKTLVADGTHWGCPGTFCGPNVSRYSTTSFDLDDRHDVPQGVEVDAECWMLGDSITDPVTATSTTSWIRTSATDGKPWMSAHYFGTADFDAVLAGIPPC